MASESHEYMAAYGAARHEENSKEYYDNNNFHTVKKVYRQHLAETLRMRSAADLKEVYVPNNSSQDFQLKGQITLKKQENGCEATVEINKTSVEYNDEKYEFKGVEKIQEYSDITEAIERISEQVATLFAEKVVLKKKIHQDLPHVKHFVRPQKVDQLNMFE